VNRPHAGLDLNADKQRRAGCAGEVGSGGVRGLHDRGVEAMPARGADQVGFRGKPEVLGLQLRHDCREVVAIHLCTAVSLRCVPGARSLRRLLFAREAVGEIAMNKGAGLYPR